MFDPSTKRLYTAEKGKGSFLNNEKISVAQTREIADAMVYIDAGKIEGNDKKRLDKIQEAAYRTRDFGLGSLGLCYLAQGGYDAYICTAQTKVVDIAAGTIIAAEAKAKITDKKGKPINLFETTGIIASNEVLHKKMLKLLE